MENFNFKKSFKPGREFEKKTKNLYLSAFNEKFAGSAAPVPSFAFNFVLHGAGVFAALLLLVTGTSTYAYGKNVGPTNVLYPLKRVQENVRVLLTPAEKKSSFHLNLAEKRLQEAEILKNENANSPRAVELINDMKSEIKKSFESLPAPQGTLPASTPLQTSSQPTVETPLTQTQEEIQPIQVISPNGGEVFGQGTPIKISWRTATFPPKDRLYVHLYLRPYVQIDKEKGELGKIDANINCFRSLPHPINSFIWDGKTVCANGKSYTINLPPSADYKIQARLYTRPDENPGKEKDHDESDAPFSIINSKQMQISSPKINPPVFGPSKNQIKETETTKQNPTRENNVFPTSSKIAPGIKSEEKINPSTSGQFSSIQPKNQNQICKFVGNLIANETNGFKKEIINDPEIAQKFNANCDGIKSVE